MIPVRIQVGSDRKRLYVATSARAKALPELAEAVRPRADDLDVWRFLEDAAKADDPTFERMVADATRSTKRDDGEITTFRDLGVEWTSGRAHEKHPTYVRAKKTSELDASRLEYLCDDAPKLGDIRLDRFTLDHALAAMSKLPKTARSQSTRRQYAQCIAYVLELAVFPYRLIPASPLPKRFRPRIGEPPEFPYLRPSEDAKLLGCTHIPIARRVLYGLLAREGMRLGEALALRFGAFDHEVESIRVKRPKTKSANEWAPSPGVLAALKAWQGERHPPRSPRERATRGPSGRWREARGAFRRRSPRSACTTFGGRASPSCWRTERRRPR